MWLRSNVHHPVGKAAPLAAVATAAADKTRKGSLETRSDESQWECKIGRRRTHRKHHQAGHAGGEWLHLVLELVTIQRQTLHLCRNTL